MLLPDMGDYISSGVAGVTTGTNLFLGKMPPVPVTAYALYETGGIFPVHAMSTGPGNAVMERPRLQVVVRSSGGYADGRTRIQSIFTRLDGAQGLTLNGIRYDYIAAVQSPFFLKFDENNNPLFAQNFDVWKTLG